MKHSDEFDMQEEEQTVTGKKGFYIALAVCLVAVCGVALTTFVSSLPGKDVGGTTTTTPTNTTQTVQQAARPVENEKDDRTTGGTKTTVTTTQSADELFVLPVSNRVVRAYSETHAYSDTLDAWVTHNGVDFAAEIGSSVKAVADGTVISIRQDAVWGCVVEIRHDGNIVSRYCGVQADGIQEKQTVKRGDTIGRLQEIPAESLDKPHLHLEMLVNQRYMDPLTLIRGETVNEQA